jgi:uncharacterized protein (DUF2235 family)
MRDLIYIIDGTLSVLDEGQETNAGLLFKLLAEDAPSRTRQLAYHAGVQGDGARRWFRAAVGLGVNDAILHGYAFLAARYQPGDRIFLFGFSRGAYAVRSLAGLIDRVGLLRAENATQRHIRRAFRFYERSHISPVVEAFRIENCHQEVFIDMLGVWDTVKALGLPYPILSRISPMATEFHHHRLGPHIRNGFHALALDETRTAFDPVLWRSAPGWRGTLQQAWFAGSHSDIGGHPDSRGLSNIPLAWMIEKAERCGLRMPDNWRDRYPTDPLSKSVGTWKGIGSLFLFREPRRVPVGDGCFLHPSVRQRMQGLPKYKPKAQIDPTLLGAGETLV